MIRHHLYRDILLLLVVPWTLFVSACRHEKADQIRIAGIVFQEDQFFRLVLFGMRDAAKREGAELLEANSAGKPDREIQLVNTYIAGGVDAIVISPLSARASLSALERAVKKGIAVVFAKTVRSTRAASSTIW